MIDLTTLRIPSNYVLIKPDAHHQEFTTKSGLTLSIGYEKNLLRKEDDNSASANWEAKHWNISATVLKVCDKIKYLGKEVADAHRRGQQELARDLTEKSLPFDSEIEVAAGDNILFNYREYISSTNEGRRIEVDGHGLCMLIPYNEIFSANSKPVNGWVWIKRKTETQDAVTFGGIFLRSAGEQAEPIAQVVALAAPIKDYLGEGDKDYGCNISVGDFVYYNWKVQAPLEHEYHETDGLHDYWKIRRKDIYYVLGHKATLPEYEYSNTTMGGHLDSLGRNNFGN